MRAVAALMSRAALVVASATVCLVASSACSGGRGLPGSGEVGPDAPPTANGYESPGSGDDPPGGDTGFVASQKCFDECSGAWSCDGAFAGSVVMHVLALHSPQGCDAISPDGRGRAVFAFELTCTGEVIEGTEIIGEWREDTEGALHLRIDGVGGKTDVACRPQVLDPLGDAGSG